MKNFLKPAAFLAAAVFIFFIFLNRIPLWSSDEGRYGEIAREAYEEGDYIVPQFNYVDYLEKPILAPLLTAGAYAVFGVNHFSARFVPAFSGFLGLLICWFFTRRHFGRSTADLAGLLLLTSVGYVLVGRFAVIDMLLTLVMSASMFCLMTAYFEKRRWLYLFAYFFMGLAFLTKGLIGFVLPGVIFFFFLLWVRDLAEIKHMKIGWGILILAVLIVPWFWAVSVRQPEFFDVFIVKNHFARFATKTFGRRKPFWFYVPILFATVFPWSLFLPAALTRALREPESEQKKKTKLLLVWAAVIFVFFSLPKSKLPYYLLPLSMPAAILFALLFDALKSGKLEARSWTARLTDGAWKAAAVLCTLLFFIMNPVIHFFIHDPEIASLRPVVLTGTAFIMAGALLAYFFYAKGRIQAAVTSLAGVVYATLFFAILGMKVITPFQSTYPLAQSLAPLLKPEDKVAVFASPDHYSDLIFHLRRRVIVVGSDRGTLTEESQQEENLEKMKEWFLSSEEMSKRFNAGEQRFFVVVDDEKLEELHNYGVKEYRTLQRSGQKLLITNDFKLPSQTLPEKTHG